MKKTIKIVIIALAVLLIVGITAGVIVFEHFYGKMNYETVDLSNTDFHPDSGWDIDPQDSDREIEESTAADNTSASDATETPDDTSSGEVISSETAGSKETTPAATTVEEIISTITTFEEASNFNPDDIPHTPVGSDVMNILVIGTDAIKDTSNGRSDAMIVVSINPTQKRIVLTSFMRDTYVYISDAKEFNKINSAHSYGGVGTLIKTFQENFGIKIDKYCRAKYADFVKVFELLGGLDMTLNLAEIKYVNDGLINDPNLQKIYKNCKNEGFKLTVTKSIPEASADKEIHLNADALFIYARARKLSGGDYKRTERQRDVLTFAFNKVKDLSLGQLVGILDKCLPLITTDMTRTDCLSFIWNAPTYSKYEIVSTRLPMDGYFIDTWEPSGHKTSWLEIKSDKKDEMMQKWAAIIND